VQKVLKKRPINSRIFIRLCLVDGFAIVLAVVVASLAASWLVDSERMPFMGRGAALSPVMALLIWTTVLVANDAYRVDLAIAGTEYYERVIRSSFFASGILAVVGFVFDVRAVRPFILIGYPIGLIIHVGFRWVVRQNIRQIVNDEGVSWRLIVVGQSEDEAIVDWSASRLPRIVVEKSFLDPDLSAVIEAMDQGNIDAVYISAHAGLSADELRELGWRAEKQGIALWFEPVTSLMAHGRISFVPFGFADVMIVRTVHLTPFQSLIKRGFDVCVTLLLLVILVPVFVITAIVIALVDGFPVLYSQHRVGRDGKEYRMYKFRTMKGEPSLMDRQFDEQQRYVTGTKAVGSQSFTKTGKFLRRWSIDETPQLIHVLTGKMSLIGPRPRLAHEMLNLPVTDRRLRARPGLTGLWQVSGRADLSFAEADALDVAYVDQWSLIGDVAIVIRTIKAVLTRRGAR
jgi:lipopolysaccharide/colanic/teichoic acid biosynthesis glycosyltransferase